MRVLLTAVVLVGTGWIIAEPAAACSCVALTDDEALEQADVAFSGIAVGDAEEGDDRVLTFEVESVYAGEVHREQEVVTPSDSAACGLDPMSGTAYLVFASSGTSGTEEDGTGSRLASHLCSGTRSLDDGGVPASFGDGEPPTEGPSSPEIGEDGTDPVWVGAVVLATLLGIATVIVLVRGRRRPAA